MVGRTRHTGPHKAKFNTQITVLTLSVGLAPNRREKRVPTQLFFPEILECLEKMHHSDNLIAHLHVLNVCYTWGCCLHHFNLDFSLK